MKRNHFADKLATLRVPQFKVALHTYYCGDKVAYKMFLGRKLLFKGTDYRPSLLYNWVDIETSLNLLSFLTVQPTDVHPNYFRNYTPTQLAWAESFECEQLKGLLNDLEYGSREHKLPYWTHFNTYFKHKIA